MPLLRLAVQVKFKCSQNWTDGISAGGGTAAVSGAVPIPFDLNDHQVAEYGVYWYTRSCLGTHSGDYFLCKFRNTCACHSRKILTLIARNDRAPFVFPTEGRCTS